MNISHGIAHHIGTHVDQRVLRQGRIDFSVSGITLKGVVQVRGELVTARPGHL